MQASIRDLRIHTKELLDAVNRGEEVIITFRGKDYAKLVPLTESHQPENSLFGLWENNPKVTEVSNFIDNLRKSRHETD
ncbi:MAG: type II toxin-antitoxin system prevent-host-death family antitoxin [Legionellales bacterium]|nr:type II toxin-antitoxin system prevent-host-death family antitoxin [Legionellales bacterium]